MADLAKLGLGAGLVSGVLQTGLGIYDRIRGNKKLKEAQSFYEKNKFQIPESAKSALSVAERQASTLRMPGEDIARARLAETTSAGVGAAQNVASSGSDVLSALSGIFGNQMQGEQNIAMQGAQRFDRNQELLRGELGNMANWEQQKWNFNTLYPYQQMLGQAEAYSGRGGQGIGMGLSGIGQTAGNYATMQGEQNRYDSWLNTMMGSNNQPNQQPNQDLYGDNMNIMQSNSYGRFQ